MNRNSNRKWRRIGTIIKNTYTKAIGVSFVFHAVLLGVLAAFGNAMATPVSHAAPIAVEFVAASVVDTGSVLTDLPGVSSPVPAQGQQSEQQAGSENHFSQQEAAAQQTHANGAATVMQTSYAGAATVGIPNAVIANAGNQATEKAGGQERKAVSRTQAGYLSGSRPAYPHEARQSGWEGTVVIRVLVDTDGSAAAVSVRSSSGHDSLDEAAAQAVKQWRFAPARRGDTPVESYFDVRVRFSLDDD